MRISIIQIHIHANRFCLHSKALSSITATEKNGFVWGACFPTIAHGTIQLTQFNCDNSMLTGKSITFNSFNSQKYSQFVCFSRSSALLFKTIYFIRRNEKFYSISSIFCLLFHIKEELPFTFIHDQINVCKKESTDQLAKIIEVKSIQAFIFI